MCAKQGKAERAGSKKQAPATSKLAPSLAKRRQHNATEVKAVQGKARQFNSSHVNSIQLKSSQLNSIQLKSSQSKSSQVKGRQPEAMHRLCRQGVDASPETAGEEEEEGHPPGAWVKGGVMDIRCQAGWLPLTRPHQKRLGPQTRS